MITISLYLIKLYELLLRSCSYNNSYILREEILRKRLNLNKNVRFLKILLQG